MPERITKRITKLTTDQLAMLPAICDQWLAHGLSTELADRSAAEAGIRAAYRAAKLDPPRFIIWLGYPMSGALGQAWAPAIISRYLDAQVDDQVYAQVDDQVDAQVRAQVYAQVDDQVRAQVDDQVDAQVRDQVYAQVYAQVDDQVRAQVYAQVDDRLKNWYAGRIAGQHWAGWYSYFAAMAELGVKNLEPLLEGQCEVGKNAGWWWAYRGFAVVTDRPAVLCRDALGRLHAEHGPAIAYRDGWGFWAWHGRRVPRWVVESPTLEAISREDNVEIRRCAIESMGWERFTAELLTDQRPAIAPDPGNPDQSLFLYDVPEGLWGARVKLLLCTNGSTERDGTRRRYGLTVPAHLTDPVEAAGWTAGLSKDEYSRMVRRT